MCITLPFLFNFLNPCLSVCFFVFCCCCCCCFCLVFFFSKQWVPYPFIRNTKCIKSCIILEPDITFSICASNKKYDCKRKLVKLRIGIMKKIIVLSFKNCMFGTLNNEIIFHQFHQMNKTFFNIKTSHNITPNMFILIQLANMTKIKIQLHSSFARMDVRGWAVLYGRCRGV